MKVLFLIGLSASNLPKKLMPRIISWSRFNYQYEWVEGTVFSREPTEKNLLTLLDLCQSDEYKFVTSQDGAKS